MHESYEQISEIKGAESKLISELPSTDTLTELAMLANAIYYPTDTRILPMYWNYWTKSSYPNGTPDFMAAFLFKYENRKEYWMQYFKYCWDVDADVRDTFKDFSKFADKMFAELKKAHDSAILEYEAEEANVMQLAQ